MRISAHEYAIQIKMTLFKVGVLEDIIGNIISLRSGFITSSDVERQVMSSLHRKIENAVLLKDGLLLKNILREANEHHPSYLRSLYLQDDMGLNFPRELNDLDVCEMPLGLLEYNTNDFLIRLYNDSVRNFFVGNAAFIPYHEYFDYVVGLHKLLTFNEHNSLLRDNHKEAHDILQKHTML